jgi:hypothetical protein
MPLCLYFLRGLPYFTLTLTSPIKGEETPMHLLNPPPLAGGVRGGGAY